MRIFVGLVIGVLGCAVAVAYTAPTGAIPGGTTVVELDAKLPDLPLPPPPPILDGDWDGYSVDVDCNDDDALAHPFGEEIDNGVDDDCDGVVDDGFDTTADWLAVRTAKALWPSHKAAQGDEMVAVHAPPRIVWTGEFYASAWGDRGNKIRLARFDRDGVLLDSHPIVVREDARNPDLAWTGTRFGIAYEDHSTMLPSVRLMILDASGATIEDVAIENNATEPKLAWGRDRFGLVWHANACSIDCLRFQRFDRLGSGIGKAEELEFSGTRAAIAFSGIGITNEAEGAGAREGSLAAGPGSFGIVYEAYYAFAPTADVRLAVRSLEPGDTPVTIVVNEHTHPVSSFGALPSIAANPTGFAVCWHEVIGQSDGASARFISLDGRQTMPELAADADAGRASRVIWTGSEFVAVNDNILGGSPDRLEVHVRRLDASGNSHLVAGWGPWREVSVSHVTPGQLSRDPDIAHSGTAFGVVWISHDDCETDGGRVWFAEIGHR